MLLLSKNIMIYYEHEAQQLRESSSLEPQKQLRIKCIAGIPSSVQPR